MKRLATNAEALGPRSGLVLSLALMTTGTAAADKPPAFDVAMQPVLAEYLKIHKALAADTDAGVPAAASQISKLVRKLKPTAVGAQSAKLSAVPKDLEAAAAKLGQAKGIDKLREAFKDLSKPMVVWASAAKPRGVKTLYCSMAKGSWLQPDKGEVANPYYGSKMLRCGEVVGAAASAASSSTGK